MLDIQKIAFDKALKLINSLPVQYKIIDDDGNEYGELEVKIIKRTKKPRSERQFKFGEQKAYYLPYIKDMQVGDIAIIPFDKYVGEHLRGGVAAWACKYWGTGSHVSTCNQEKQIIEVLRIA